LKSEKCEKQEKAKKDPKTTKSKKMNRNGIDGRSEKTPVGARKMHFVFFFFWTKKTKKSSGFHFTPCPLLKEDPLTTQKKGN